MSFLSMLIELNKITQIRLLHSLPIYHLSKGLLQGYFIVYTYARI